jgi:transcriptional regulator with XRE-family HTH domain
MRERLKIGFIKAGRTQRQVAMQIGLPETRLSAVVNGWVTASPEERRLIAAALDQPVAILFGDDEQAEN